MLDGKKTLFSGHREPDTWQLSGSFKELGYHQR